MFDIMRIDSRNLVVAVGCAALAVSCASADTYYWKPCSTQGLWTVLSNWSTEAVDGADAATLPSESDVLYGAGSYNFDLGGGAYALGGLQTPGDWSNHQLTVANGALAFKGEVSTHSGRINVDSGGRLDFLPGSSLVLGLYSSMAMSVNVRAGGEMSVAGGVRLYNGSISVASGGSMTFAPSNLRFGPEAHGFAGSFRNSGTLALPNGFAFDRWDAAAVDAGSSFALIQKAGVLSLGGPVYNAPAGEFSKPGVFSVVLAGGTVNAVADVSFDVTSLSVENSIAVNVDAGNTFNMLPAVFAPGASIAKTGAGLVALPTSGSAGAISEGGISIVSSSKYDLSSVVFAKGTVVKMAVLGATVDAFDPSFVSNTTFVADLKGVAAGSTVIASRDANLLAKARADLESSVPVGFELAVGAGVLSLEARATSSFTRSGDLLSGAGWGGSVPRSGDVAIDGTGVVATLSSGAFPGWSSVEVKNGATLRVATSVVLPPITLNKSARLEIANGAIVTLAHVVDLSCVATAQQVPELAVDFDSMLNIPGGMRFSNVNIDLAGTLYVTSDGGVIFGYAAAGETTYIGFKSNLGTIQLMPDLNADYNTSPFGFCCPEAGGSVVPVGKFVLTDTTLLPRYERSLVPYTFTESYQICFCLGVNNPETLPFEVVFDGTDWGVLGSFFVRGGATFRLANGGSYKTFESVGYWNRHAQVAERGRIVVGSGCEFRLNSLGDFGTHALEVNPTSPGHQSIVVEDGGIFETYRTSGNGNGVFAASNGVYRIYQPRQYSKHFSETTGETIVYDTTNVPFAGFSSVNLAEGAKLVFTTRNKVFWDAGQFDESSGARIVALADVPISGKNASIELSNDDVNVFGVVVRSGGNTATGTAGVKEPGPGLGATTLYFADGANWAGTVVSGDVALTNLVDAAAGAAVTFNDLRLARGVLEVRSGDTLTVNGAIVSQDGDSGSLVVADGRASLRAKSATAFDKANVTDPHGKRLLLKPSAAADAKGYYSFRP